MLAIIQARMTSHRLPGKVLRELAGRPLLDWTVARLQLARRLTRIVVATSDDPSDDAIAAHCAATGVACHRGSLDDVAGRIAAAAQAERADAFVRVSGDSPLIDPALVDNAIALFESADCDLVTNVFTRSFPKGQSVEVLRTSTFMDAYAAMSDRRDREHCTTIYYAAPERYRIVSFTSGMDAGSIQLSVDTEEDFRVAGQVIAAAQGRPGGWHDLVVCRESLAR